MVKQKNLNIVTELTDRHFKKMSLPHTNSKSLPFSVNISG